MKRKAVRLSCTVHGKVGAYIDWLLAQGMYGETRSAVVKRMLCNGIIEALPPGRMAAISDAFDKVRPPHSAGASPGE